MKQVNVMQKNALLFIIIFSVGLPALSDTHATIIRNEVNVCEGDQAILPCGGSSGMRYRWKLHVTHGIRRGIPFDASKYSYDNSSLIVKNVQQADTKRLFYCRTYSTVHQYRVTYIYNLKIICKDVVVYNGSQISLQCNVDIPDKDIEKIEWKFHTKHHGKAKRLLSQAVNGRMTTSGRKLTINNVRMEDCGTFTCLASRKKNLHLSKERYFYNVIVKMAPKATSSPPSHTMMPLTDRSIRSVNTTVKITTIPAKGSTIARTSSAKTIKLPRKTAISRQTTTMLPSFPTIKTKKSFTQKTEITSSNDGKTTLMPETQPGIVSKLPTTLTWSPSNTIKYNPSLKATSMTNEPKETSSKHPIIPTTETVNNEKFQQKLSSRHHRKRTSSPNAVESGNDNQKAEGPTTVRSSSGTIVSVVPMVGPYALGLFILLYCT